MSDTQSTDKESMRHRRYSRRQFRAYQQIIVERTAKGPDATEPLDAAGTGEQAMTFAEWTSATS